MELRLYAIILKRWWWLIVLGMILAAGSAYIVFSMQSPVYRASSKLLINQAPSEGVSEYTAILTSERLSRTYVEMITQQPVLDETMERLDVQSSVLSLGSISVQPVRDTLLIIVSVEHENPEWAATVANMLVEVFSAQNQTLQESRYVEPKVNLEGELERLRAQIQSIEAQLVDLDDSVSSAETSELSRLQTDLAQYRLSYTNLLQSYEDLRIAEARAYSNVVMVEPAQAPVNPIRPKVITNTILAAVVGAMIAVGGVFLVEYLDDTIKSSDEIIQRLDLPVLGLIISNGRSENGTTYIEKHPRSPLSEAYRTLHAKVGFVNVDHPVRTLLITSPGPREGKSTVAVNLAVVMAQGGSKVILMESDLRRPSTHRKLGVTNRVGLTDLFVRIPPEFEQVLFTSRIDNLRYMTSGGLPQRPVELLSSERMNKIIQYAASKADIVILDSPPAGVVTDAAVLATQVDAVLLVVKSKGTRLPAAVHTLEQLKLAGANVIGVVLNNVTKQDAAYYNNYYSSYYTYFTHESRDGGEELMPRRQGRSRFRA